MTKRNKDWLGLLLLGTTLLGTACSDRPGAPGPLPLVSAEDRQLLDDMKQKKVERADLEASPWKYVTSGDGKVAVFDKGIINTYTEIRGYPLHNQSRFDIVSLEAEVKMMRADDTVIATVPVQFKGGLLAGENKVLEASSSTVQGGAAKFTVHVTKVKLHSD
jgi:hypothetical protein